MQHFTIIITQILLSFFYYKQWLRHPYIARLLSADWKWHLIVSLGLSFGPVLAYSVCNIIFPQNKPCGYWDEIVFDHGITNGADWYSLTGGMQVCFIWSPCNCSELVHQCHLLKLIAPMCQSRNFSSYLS